MDVWSVLEKILTSSITYVVTAILLPAIVALVPRTRRWFTENPLSSALLSGAFAAAVTSGLIWTLLPVESKSISFSVKQHGFNDVRQYSVIPGSQGAIFCALAVVDDDSANAYCEVSSQNGEWMIKTGEGPSWNGCSVHCLFADQKG